jgi:CubicO group peptidase (beta-lactamase class C family)
MGRMALNLTLAALAVLTTHCGSTQSTRIDESLVAALQRSSAAIDEAVAAGQIPGAVLLVGRGDEVLHRGAFGSRARQPIVEPMTLDTVFDLASLSKVVGTATSVMMLVESGKVALDAPVAQYLPAFGANGKDSVTVEQLLLHQAFGDRPPVQRQLVRGSVQQLYRLPPDRPHHVRRY